MLCQKLAKNVNNRVFTPENDIPELLSLKFISLPGKETGRCHGVRDGTRITVTGSLYGPELQLPSWQIKD